MKLANLKALLVGIAAVGISFAFLGPMGGRPGGSAESSGSNVSGSSGMPMGGGMGGGLPLLEIGIGLAILAALIWWFDLRKQGKKQ